MAERDLTLRRPDSPASIRQALPRLAFNVLTSRNGRTGLKQEK